MKTNRYEFAVRTVIGTREEQQDSVATLVQDDAFAAVVCDGMGGLEGGQKASRIVVDTLIDFIKNRDEAEPISSLYLRSIDILDERVFALIDDEGEKLNAGTTVVSVYIKDDSLFWMSVGDSRLYILRGDDIVTATRDHNYFLTLNAMPESFIPTDDDLAKGNALISYIGMGGVSIMDISNNPVALVPEDYILLTTDGLFKAIPDEKIKEIIRSSAPLAEKADRLLRTAEELSPENRDNISFVIISVKENNNEADQV